MSFWQRLFGRKSSRPTTPVRSSGGFQTFTSSDHSFSIAYPGDWQQKAMPSGTDYEFTSQDQQKAFKVAVIGTPRWNPAKAVTAAYSNADGPHGSPQIVSIGGQSWTKAEFDLRGSLHMVAEAVSYKGKGFTIVYTSPRASFASDASQFFTPMEQSFQFLSNRRGR